MTLKRALGNTRVLMSDLRLLVELLKKLETVDRKCDRISARLDLMEDRLRRVAAIDPDRRYTRKETATLLCVSTRTVDRHLRAGHLQAARVNRRVHVVGRSIIQYGQRRRRSAAMQVMRL